LNIRKLYDEDSLPLRRKDDDEWMFHKFKVISSAMKDVGIDNLVDIYYNITGLFENEAGDDIEYLYNKMNN
jgi:hypothetical protein